LRGGGPTKKAGTRRVICQWPVPVNPFLTAVSHIRDDKGTAGKEVPAGRLPEETVKVLGSFVIQCVQNRVIGDFAAPHIQAIGKMWIALQRRHAVIGQCQNMRQSGVVQRL